MLDMPSFMPHRKELNISLVSFQGFNVMDTPSMSCLRTSESRVVPTHHFSLLVLLESVMTEMSSGQLPWALGSCLSHCIWPPSPYISPRKALSFTPQYRLIPHQSIVHWLNVSGEMGLAVGLGLGRNNLEVLYWVELYLILLLLYSLLEQVRESTVTSVEKEGESWWQVEYMPSTSTANSWKMDCFKPGSLHT